MAQTNKPLGQGQKPGSTKKITDWQAGDANMPMGKAPVGSPLYNYQQSQGGSGATNQGQNGFGAKPTGGSGATNGVPRIGGQQQSALSQMQSFMPTTSAFAQPTGNPAASPVIHPMTPNLPPAGLPTSGYSGQTNQYPGDANQNYAGGQTNQGYLSGGHLAPPNQALPPVDIHTLLTRWLASRMQQQQAQSPYTQFLSGLPMLQ